MTLTTLVESFRALRSQHSNENSDKIHRSVITRLDEVISMTIQSHMIQIAIFK